VSVTVRVPARPTTVLFDWWQGLLGAGLWLPLAAAVVARGDGQLRAVAVLTGCALLTGALVRLIGPWRPGVPADRRWLSGGAVVLAVAVGVSVRWSVGTALAALALAVSLAWPLSGLVETPSRSGGRMAGPLVPAGLAVGLAGVALLVPRLTPAGELLTVCLCALGVGVTGIFVAFSLIRARPG
jgi:hypothetical protein